MSTRSLAVLACFTVLLGTACGGVDELDRRADSLGLTRPRSPFGLTFGAARALVPEGTVYMSCHGTPKGVENSHEGSCNPYAGDTRCEAALPILCIRKGEQPAPPGYPFGFYNGWVHGELASTAPVVGRALTSRAVADAACAAELGRDYRMAEFHDGDGGWGFLGVQGGVQEGQRHWVRIDDQPGNCWDAPALADPPPAQR